MKLSTIISRSINGDFSFVCRFCYDIYKVFLGRFRLAGGYIRIQIVGEEIHALRPMRPRRHQSVSRIAIFDIYRIENTTGPFFVLTTTRRVRVTHDRTITLNNHLLDVAERQRLRTLTLLQINRFHHYRSVLQHTLYRNMGIVIGGGQNSVVLFGVS